MFQANTNASLKNLETQVGKLAIAMQNQSKDAFPSDIRKNPKYCMVVTLRRGRAIKGRKKKKRRKLRKRKKKLEKNRSCIVHKWLKKREVQKSRKSSKLKREFCRKRKRFKLTRLKSHFLKGCKRLS